MPQTNITNINNLKLLLQSIALILLLFTLWTIFSPTKASAATITVGGACTLDDAVASMNSASDQSGCSSVGAYGTTDTVNLPAGTFPYTNTEIIDVPLVVQGAGMGETIIDCGGNNEGLIFRNIGLTPMAAIVQDLSILNPDDGSNPGTASIEVNGYDATIRRVEVYADAPQSIGLAINIAHDISNDRSALVEDVYVHDLTVVDGVVNVYSKNGMDSEDNLIRRLTIDSVEGTSINGVSVTTFGVYENGGSISGIIENSTFTGVTATNSNTVVYINSAANPSGGSSSTADTIAQNITIYSEDDPGVNHIPVFSFAMAAGGDEATSTLAFQNILGAGVLAIGQGLTIGLGGTESTSLTSLGGNIIDGADSPDLDHPSDQAEVAGLADTLSPLQDNGGLTPTIALLPDSAAIDAGITNSLTDDQIGTSRPQGLAYDSGAFEFITPDEVDEGEEEGEDGQGNDGEGSEADELADTGQNSLIFQLLALSVLTLLTARYYQPLYAKISTRIKK